MRTFQLLKRDLRPGCREIQVEGEVDLAVSDQLREAIEGVQDAEIVIGLERCEFIDSTVIAVILRAHHEMAANGRRVTLYGPSSQVRRVLSITGLVENGLVFESAEEALAAMRTPA